MTESPRRSRRLLSAGLAAVLTVSAATALAAVSEGDYAGKTEDEIIKSLEAQGYTVRKIETEDGYLEAYALLDGQRYEIYVDPETGKVAKVKRDD